MQQRQSDIKKLAKEDKDFILRRLQPRTQRILFTFIGVFLINLFALSQSDIIGTAPAIGLFLASFSILAFVSFLYLRKVKEIIYSNEFENALYTGAVNAGAEFTIIVKRDKQIVYFSPGFHRYFTHKISDTGDSLETLLKSMGLHIEAQQVLINAFNARKKDQITFTSRNPFDPEAPKKSLLLTLEPIPRPSGYFMLRAVDHSKRKDPRVFTPPSIEETALLRLLDDLPWGAYKISESGHLVFANDIFASLIGHNKQEIIQGHLLFSEFLDDTERTTNGEVQLKNKEGESTNVTIKEFLIPEKEENTLSHYGFIIDSGNTISTALPETAGEQFDIVWSQCIAPLPMAIALIDNKGAILKSNAYFNKGHGEHPPSFKELLAPESFEHFTTLLTQTTSQEVMSEEVSLIDKDHESATLYLIPFEMADKDTPCFMVYLIDTTEQKNLQEHFIHAQKMQAIGQLAGGIAHDFNNLLTAMIGFCDLLLIRHPAGDQSFPDIMQIKQNANRAANLVRQLLAFSRKQTLQPKVINITDVLAELSNLIRRLIGENIELKMLHDRDVGKIKADYGQLEQVIINLAVNARDAMENGGELTIKTKNVIVDQAHPIDPSLIPPAQDDRIEYGNYSVIEISDTGHGIPDDILSQVFEPFFTTKEVGSGTGLGLATVYGIIRQTGGHIYVKSAPFAGTTFSIFLKQYEEEEEGLTTEKDPETMPSQDLTGEGTILLVEDESPVRIFSARALRNKGYNVFEADSGESALAIIEDKGEEIEVIVTDVVMPGITGPTMAEKILEHYPHMKVIFISGYGEDAFVKSYGSERSFHFLPKPFTLKQLAAKVKEVLEGNNSSPTNSLEMFEIAE